MSNRDYVKRDIMSDPARLTQEYQKGLLDIKDYSSLGLIHENMFKHVIRNHVYGLDELSIDDMDDLMQIARYAALKAYMSWREFDDPDTGYSISNWTYEYVKTYLVRARQAMNKANGLFESLTDYEADYEMLSDEMIELSDEGAHWREAEGLIDADKLLEGLPERARQACILYNADHSQAEIAEILGISQPTVSRLLDRTLKLIYEK